MYNILIETFHHGTEQSKGINLLVSNMQAKQLHPDNTHYTIMWHCNLSVPVHSNSFLPGAAHNPSSIVW